MTTSIPEPERARSTELPFGPLPARSGEPTPPEQPSREPDPLFRLAWLAEDPPDEDDSVGERSAPIPVEDASPESDDELPKEVEGLGRDLAGEDEAERSSELEITAARGEADDDVHFGVAAKALGVSRKTVERMVKRGQLDRGPSGAPATVSKRSLVNELDHRRRDISQLTQATAVAPRETGYDESAVPWSPDMTSQLQEMLRPILAPLLDEFVNARTRAAMLESQMEESMAARAPQERARDELLLALATGGWRERRKARRMALRHYVLRDHLDR